MNLQEEIACLVSAGRVVEAGWLHYRAQSVHPMASEQQVFEMRMTFFAGAQHVFSNMVDAARRREDHSEAFKLQLMDRELRDFIADYQLYNAPVGGRA